MRDVRLSAKQFDGFEIQKRIRRLLVERVVRKNHFSPELVSPLCKRNGEADVRRDHAGGDDGKVPFVLRKQIRTHQANL